MGNVRTIKVDLSPVQVVVDAIRATDVVNLTTDIASNKTVVDLIRGTDVPALAAEHVAIDTVVDAIRAVDFPATDSLIGTVNGMVGALGIIVTDIHDTDLPVVVTAVGLIRSTDVPALAAEHVVIDTVVDAIRATDVPAIQSVVNAIRATDVPAIQTAVELIPIKNRGEFLLESGSDTATGYIDILSLTGSGKLYGILVRNISGSGINITIALDGLTFINVAGDPLGGYWWIVPNNGAWEMNAMSVTDGYCWLNLEYKNSILIRMHGAGTNQWWYQIYHAVD